MDNLETLFLQNGLENTTFVNEYLDIRILYPQPFDPSKIIKTLEYDPNLFERTRLATAVHFAEDIFVAKYHRAWWVYFNASQGFELATPPAEVYLDTVVQNKSNTYYYLFDLMVNPMLYEGIPENQRILTMSLEELHAYIKSAQMKTEEKLLQEAIWGAERSILAYKPHMKGIRLKKNEADIRSTVLALTDFHFMIFYRQLSGVPGIRDYLKAQKYFREKIKRVRKRYQIYTERGLIRYKDFD